MTTDKEHGYNLIVIFNSWSWGKLTESEKDKFISFINSGVANDAIKGTPQQRQKILNSLYQAYLFGVGYSGFAWRCSGAKR